MGGTESTLALRKTKNVSRRQSLFRFLAPEPRALPGAESAFDAREPRRAMARSRRGREGGSSRPSRGRVPAPRAR
ncbi:hypothetical protein SBA4_2020010 [Candidatus Sulfopaludibacter sp. SbA4]|nr:hypothetical protein SBA4_2020010 [Candidatus Sulfopaludibacter sp. SbA4]